MLKPAYIRWNGPRNGTTRRASLRAGATGKGRVLRSVTYWTMDAASTKRALEVLEAAAAQEGFIIVANDQE